MKKKLIFRGVGTALITPMKNGKIDYISLEKIIEMQIAAKIDALVIGGTTGEVATLSDYEREKLYTFSAEKIAGRTKLIFGAGTNDTEAAMRHARLAGKIGCDGILVVTPYYNKGTHRGVTEHYQRVSEAGGLPTLLYNVPSRTGVNLTQKQLSELSENPLICGIKEALDSIDRFVDIAAMGGSLPLYSGSDYATYTALSLGGAGVISVVSNIYPERMLNISRSYFSGNNSAALSAQLELSGFIKAMFTETNPSPIKYAMSLIGLCEADVRLPLYPPEEKTCELIRAEMRKLIL